MGPEVWERDLGGNVLHAYMRRHGERQVIVVDPGLPEAYKRSREIENLSDWLRPAKRDRRLCFSARNVEDLDPVSVHAIKRLIFDLEPAWVECVRGVCAYADDLETIADECGLEEHAVAAIVSGLIEVGELPPREAPPGDLQP